MLRTFLQYADAQLDKIKSIFWREMRCENCGNILGREYVNWGRLELRCGDCGHYNIIMFRSKWVELKRAFEQERGGYDTSRDELVQVLLDRNKQHGKEPKM